MISASFLESFFISVPSKRVLRKIALEFERTLMKKERAKRGVECVSVEVPDALLGWVDRVAKKTESSRSGIVRIALRKLKEQEEADKGGVK